MDQPLFGERKQATTVGVYILAGFVTVWVLFCVIVAVVFGAKEEKEHFVMAATLICVYLALAILYKWWSAGELDPKMKWLIIYMVFIVILTGVALNCYVWRPKPFIPPPIVCNGLYDVNKKVCFSGVNDCFTPSKCLTINGNDWFCSNRNCTAPQPTQPMFF